MLISSGDTFVILSRARGWWVVQRDPTGSGIVDADIVKQGWVPAGCLLETNVPVASAIAEATAAKNGSTSSSSADTPVSKTPILPLSIISTSFPGIALMDYKKKGDEELDLLKDDALRVFKRYNHWSYVSFSALSLKLVVLTVCILQAVKEVGGDRGWVPVRLLPPSRLQVSDPFLSSHGSLVKFQHMASYRQHRIRVFHCQVPHPAWMITRLRFHQCPPHSHQFNREQQQ
jgi:bZIP factor